MHLSFFFVFLQTICIVGEMRRKQIYPYLLGTALILLCSSWHQNVKSELQSDLHRSAGVNYVVPTTHQLPQPEAPQGKKPFCISYFGCNGSSRLSKPSTYGEPYLTMARADKLGKLTPFGKEVLQRLALLRREADNRWGELTTMGIAQQYGIANRMADRHPEMFADSVKIIAHSLMTTRALLTMEHMLLQLARRCSHRVYHSASNAYSYYLYHLDEETLASRRDSATQACYSAFVKDQQTADGLMSRLFADRQYARDSIDIQTLGRQLFRLAGGIQNTALEGTVTLYDLFTEEEIYRYWEQQNALNYVNYGNFSLSDPRRPAVQSQLLRRLIAISDSCMAYNTPHTIIHIGDETGLIPLVCQMGINGYGLKTDRLETLAERGWADYRISPSSGNVQVVFYRRDLADDDVLIRVLLNEEEATLPIDTDVAPFYHWNDCKAYFQNNTDVHE